MFNFLNNIFSSFVGRKNLDDNINFHAFDNTTEDDDKPKSAVDEYFRQLRSNQGVGGMSDVGFSDYLFGAVATAKPVRLNAYRRMAMFPEVGDAIDEICEATLNFDENLKCVTADFDTSAVDIQGDMKLMEMQEAAEQYLSLFDFENNMFEYTKKLVVDAELCWENIIDQGNSEDGILDVKFIPTETYEFAVNLKTMDKEGLCVLCDTASLNTEALKQSSQNYVGSMQGGVQSIPLQQSSRIENGEMVYLPWSQVTYINTGDTTSDGMLIYPILERARKAYNQLQLIEDAVLIYRLVRAPERLVFNVDPGDLPRAKAEQEVLKMMKRYQTKKVYNPTTGTISNNYDPYTMMECLAMSTKVELLDGRSLSISEIESEMKTGKTLWTYSCDPESGEIVPGVIDFAGVTRPDAEVVQIMFCNGKSEVVTPDHAFPVWGRGRVEAMDLRVGDRIISFAKNADGGIYDHKRGCWINPTSFDIEPIQFDGKSNHDIMVAGIQKLDYRIDTGCITVDIHEKYHKHHTFALSSGVFCFNSFWFVKPQNGQGTSVETLSTGQNLDELKDMEYFVRKLYIALKVPFNRYKEATVNVENGDAISYEEYRFAKFIIRLQTQMAKGVTDGLVTHLKLKNLWPEGMIKRNVKVKFTPPSAYDLFQSSKILQNKLANYTGMSDREEFSQTLLMKKYLGWSDDEIKQNYKMKHDDLIRSSKLKFIAGQVEQSGEYKPQDAEQKPQQGGSQPPPAGGPAPLGG